MKVARQLIKTLVFLLWKKMNPACLRQNEVFAYARFYKTIIIHICIYNLILNILHHSYVNPNLTPTWENQ